MTLVLPMLICRGDAFRDYPARVSAFAPFPPRSRSLQTAETS